MSLDALTHIIDGEEVKLHPMPVHVVGESEQGEKLQAADFGSWNTFAFAGTENALQILPYDRFRRRAIITAKNPAVSSPTAVGANTFTNPGAGQAIASISAATLQAIQPGTGLWLVTWMASLQGTVLAADANNMGVFSNLIDRELGIFPGVVGDYAQTPFQFVMANTASGFTVQAIAAASGAAATYGAQIVATPLGYDGLFLLVGSRRQVQNGQGAQIYAGDSYTMEDVQDVYATVVGGNPINLVVLAERFSPYEQRARQDSESSHGNT
jgi:hypothetical protein